MPATHGGSRSAGEIRPTFSVCFAHNVAPQVFGVSPGQVTLHPRFPASCKEPPVTRDDRVRVDGGCTGLHSAGDRQPRAPRSADLLIRGTRAPHSTEGLMRARSCARGIRTSATRPERAQRVYDVNAVRSARAACGGRLARRVLPHREVRHRETRLLEAAIRIATLIDAVVVSAERPECVRCLPPQTAPTTPAARRGELDVQQARRRSARVRPVVRD